MLVFAMTAHEYAHAVVALHEGDDTAYALGRVTLNPIPHIDPWMSLLFPALLYFGTNGAFTFGGAKPVPVNPRKYRKFVRGDLLVSVAGVATNFVLAFVFAFLYVVLGLLAQAAPGAAAVLETAQRMMVQGIWINLILCFFNLIPIPPLDGSHVVAHLLPRPLADGYREMGRYGLLIVMAMIFLVPGVMDFFLTPVTELRGLADRFIRLWI